MSKQKPEKLVKSKLVDNLQIKASNKRRLWNESLIKPDFLEMIINVFRANQNDEKQRSSYSQKRTLEKYNKEEQFTSRQREQIREKSREISASTNIEETIEDSNELKEQKRKKKRNLFLQLLQGIGALVQNILRANKIEQVEGKYVAENQSPNIETLKKQELENVAASKQRNNFDFKGAAVEEWGVASEVEKQVAARHGDKMAGIVPGSAGYAAKELARNQGNNKQNGGISGL